jgi:hypothetical protein
MRTHFILAISVLASGALHAATDKVDWAAVPSTEIMLFSPGQVSYQWIYSPTHRRGARGLRQNETCLNCHEGEEQEMGETIEREDPVDPEPIPGKPTSLPLTLQAAHDDKHLYLRASWPAKTPGEYHATIVYDAGKWERFGDHRGAAAVRAGKAPAIYEDRFAIMLGDGERVPEFDILGCWDTCHNDMRFMPDHPAREEVEAHPLLGTQGLRRTDIRKYLPSSRTAMDETGGWRHTKPREELDGLRAEGRFVDLWQWRAHRSAPVGMADDGFVLEYRLFDEGKRMFADNWDAEAGRPLYMFDPAKNDGQAGVTAEAIADGSAPAALILDENTVPYDPEYAWKDGDVLYRIYLTREVSGSAADNRNVTSQHADGRWTLVWQRPLDTGSPLDDVVLQRGRVYPVGFAVHDDNVTGRWHYVSFPFHLGIGTEEGNIHAVTLP